MAKKVKNSAPMCAPDSPAYTMLYNAVFDDTYKAAQDAAERNYLAALLNCDLDNAPFNGYDFGTWCGKVQLDTFANDKHKAIYKAAIAAYMESESGTPDWFADIPRIAHANKFKIDGALLIDLIEEGISSNIDKYTKSLNQYADKRKQVDIVGKLYDAAAQGATPYDLQVMLQEGLMHLEQATEGEHPTLVDLATIDEATPDEGKFLLEVRGVGILKTKNIHAVTAVAGQGKTQFLKLISGAMLNPQGVGYIRPTSVGKKVLYIDTEQELSDIKSLCKAVRSLSPDTFSKHTFEAHSMIDFTTQARRARYVSLVKRSKADLIVIDGITDMMQNTNDIEETTALRDELKILANKCNCAIVLVIHQNESAENERTSKMRGAVGSEMARKVSNSFYVSNSMIEGVKVFKVENKKARNQEMADVYFTLSNEGVPTLCNIADLTKSKNIAVVQPWFDWCDKQGLAAKHGNLKKAIAALSGKTEGTAANDITKYKNQGVIMVNEEGIYSVCH